MSRQVSGGTIRRGHHMPTPVETRDCPQCGEKMRRKDMEVVEYVPGTTEPKRRRSSEWVCPECDHFEEVEDDGRR